MTTPHGRLDYVDLAPAYRKFPRFPMISISHSQRSGLADANWLATIHHGLPTGIYEPTFEPAAAEPYLAFLGRLSRDKRPDRAIEIASRSGLKLKMAAKIGDDDRAYFHEAVEPLIDGDRIDYIGEIEEDRKAEFLGNSAGLLFPIDWPEPFGLVVIEAMACGTPVIAWNCGAMPEIVDQGVTGFVVGSIDEAVAAVAGLAAARQAKGASRLRKAIFRRENGPRLRGRLFAADRCHVASEGFVNGARSAVGSEMRRFVTMTQLDERKLDPAVALARSTRPPRVSRIGCSRSSTATVLSLPTPMATSAAPAMVCSATTRVCSRSSG